MSHPREPEPGGSPDGSAAASCSSGTNHPAQTPQPTGLARLNHIVVIVLENWSFDSLYGQMPGADGLAAAASAPPQVDATGTPYATLPQTETHLPQTLPNAPFALDTYIPADAETSTDLTNNFYEEQRQIHGGRMDQFVLYLFQKTLHSAFLDGSKRHSVTTRSTAIALRHPVGLLKALHVADMNV